MLLRSTALALLLANAGYFAWGQGWLAPIGLAPASGREPQRLQQQVRPEALSVTPAASQQPPAPAPAPVPATAPAPAQATAAAAGDTGCWQAGPFDEAQAQALAAALATAGLSTQDWTLERSSQGSGRWIVYLGRYADADALERTRAELRALRVDTAPITQPALAPGLSLGVFSTQEAAQEQLAQLERRGVRAARVVPELRDGAPARLRLPSADAALRERVRALGPALAGHDLSPC